MQGAPQTPHLSSAGDPSPSTDFLAISKISGAMIGSAVGFFFILAFTIEQIGASGVLLLLISTDKQFILPGSLR